MRHDEHYVEALAASAGAPIGRLIPIDLIDPHQRGMEGRYIYAFWHENMLLPAYHYGRPDIRVLISQHADGQLIAEICRHLRFSLVRGSTRGFGGNMVLSFNTSSSTTFPAIRMVSKRAANSVSPSVLVKSSMRAEP